jgi:hypothetical protein
MVVTYHDLEETMTLSVGDRIDPRPRPARNARATARAPRPGAAFHLLEAIGLGDISVLAPVMDGHHQILRGGFQIGGDRRKPITTIVTPPGAACRRKPESPVQFGCETIRTRDRPVR